MNSISIGWLETVFLNRKLPNLNRRLEQCLEFIRFRIYIVIIDANLFQSVHPKHRCSFKDVQTMLTFKNQWVECSQRTSRKSILQSLASDFYDILVYYTYKYHETRVCSRGRER